MKLSKNLGRIATTFLATAMLAAFAAVPASAAAISDGTSGQKGTAGAGNNQAIGSLQFNSVLWLPNDTVIPGVTYTYTLSEVESVSENISNDNGTVAVKPSKDTIVAASDVMTATATFSAGSSLDGSNPATGVSSTTSQVTFDLTSTGDSKVLNFSEVGIYKYTLTQAMTSPADSEPNAEDFKNTKITRSVYLYVARTAAGQYEVTGAVMVNDAQYDKSKKSDGNIINYYMLSGDPDEPGTTPVVLTNKVVVTNTITGAMGDMTDKFVYTIKVQNASDTTKSYKYVVKNGDSQVATGTLTSGTEAELKDTNSLGNNYTITIYGLDKDDTYTITRVTENDNRGYTVTNTSDVDATNVATGELELVADGNGALQAANITFTNERNAIAPTGLVMNVAPYVLLVLVAAGAGYVFLRKREED